LIKVLSNLVFIICKPIGFIFLFVGASNLLAQTTTTTEVYWQTWRHLSTDHPIGDGESDPGGATIILKGRNAAGAAHTLHSGNANGFGLDGDLVELGYYKTAGTDGTKGNTDDIPNTGGSGSLFKGVWTPLTSKTTIGHKHDSSFENTAGEFYFRTLFSQGSGASNKNNAITNFMETSDDYDIVNDALAGLNAEIADLDAESTGRLGIRFYDIGQSSNGGGTAANKASGTTMYNTIMAAGWNWSNTGSDVIMYMELTDTGQEFEFQNDGTGYNSYVKVGTGSGTAVNAASSNYVTSLTYLAAGDTLNLNTTGSAILSGLDIANTGTTITDNGNGQMVTLHSAAGNTGNEAYTYAGSIAGDTSVYKTGAGNQILTGTVNVTDSTGFLDIKEGSITLKPRDGVSQSFEYLQGASGTTLNLDNSADGDQTLVLGFSATTASKDYQGTVDLTGSGSSTTLQVGSTTDGSSYGLEQVLSGQLTGDGSEQLKKSGEGRLKLSNSGNDFTNGNTNTSVIINDGTLVASHASALGGANNKIVINKGKLELDGDITLANTSILGSASGKSMVGGDGTFSSITVGSGTNEIKAISPGRGISSSLSPSNHQVTLGTGGAAANAMGDLTVTTLVLNDGAVFDWEISDFNSGANQSSFNNEFDVLNFGTLQFGSGAVIDLNIFSVASNGTAGAVAGLGVNTGNNGIVFLNGAAHSNITWGGTTLAEGSWSDASAYFDVNNHAYNYHNGNIHGGWTAWYNGSGDFYLRYSAVPEPSTYVMVTGLLLLPGFRLCRRLRKGFSNSEKDENSRSV
jgi:hypothetical protein